MIKQDNNLQAFFALLRAGLWGKAVRLSPFESIDFDAVYTLSCQQSVIGLVAAGMEYVTDAKPDKQGVFPFMKDVLSIESRNVSMNHFIEGLLKRLESEGIKALLVKGQGVAQCYMRPLWRASGDVDLFLDGVDYEKAKAFFPGIATSPIEPESTYTKHVDMQIGQWEVELHGNMRACVTRRMDEMIDAVQRDMFDRDDVRVWNNGESKVLLPSPDYDVIFVFTHILHHFYRGGVGLRQICDWCRLLYTYREQINTDLLSKRLLLAGIMKEWTGFGHFVVDYLGMPEEAMPFYASPSAKDRFRAKMILSFLLKTGNFGKNRDMSYVKKYPFFIRKVVALFRNGGDIIHHFFLFPDNSFRYFFRFLRTGVKATLNGIG